MEISATGLWAMDTSEQKGGAGEFFRTFLLAVLAVIGSLMIRELTIAPESVRERELQGQIRDSLLLVFEALDEEGLNGDAEFSAIRSDLETAEELQSEAKEIWDSIPAGEVIARGRPSNMRPVGRNAERRQLIDRAEALEKDAQRRKVHVAERHGSELLATSRKDVWHKQMSLTAGLASLHERNAWYYKTSWGSCVAFIHGLSVLTLFASSAWSLLSLAACLFALE